MWENIQRCQFHISFKEVESKYNLGEITFFVENILENVIEGQNSILELIEKTIERRNIWIKFVKKLKIKEKM